MRYPEGHKKGTHERIVTAASRAFRRRGKEGVAIADLMQKLELTHGGFYRHFGSKEQLFVESFEKGFEDVRERVRYAVDNRPDDILKAIIEEYLSLDHCTNPETGCPMAAMASEIARQPRSLRRKIECVLDDQIDELSKLLPGERDEQRRNFYVLFSGMVGTLGLARSVTDEDRRRDILQAAKEFYVKAFCPQ